MFFTIPNEKDYILTTTPAGAKSIQYVFFEAKNDSLFEYKKTLDRITILIDGKQICRNVPILPFMTTQPYGTRKHCWKDVALAVNLNVNFSEIKISLEKDKDSNVNDNDFNIVFVCSDKPTDESKGYDFVEAKKFRLKGKYFNSLLEASNYLTSHWNEAKANYQEAHEQWVIDCQIWQEHTEVYAQYDVDVEAYNDGQPPVEPAEGASDAVIEQYNADLEAYNDGQPPVEPSYERPSEEPPVEPLNPIDIGIEIPTGSGKFYWGQTTDEHGTAQENRNRLYNEYDSSDSAFDTELQTSFDYEPDRFFAYPIFSAQSEYEDSAYGERIIPSDVYYNMTLSGADNELLPPHIDLSLFSANDAIPYRKAIHQFDEPIKRSGISVSISKNDAEMSSNKGLNPINIDLYLMFMYKKIS